MTLHETDDAVAGSLSPLLSDDPLPSLHLDPRVRAAARQLVIAVRIATRQRALTGDAYQAALDTLGARRGQPLALPLLSSASGRGARVRLADGREVIDMVSGIGPYVFGHHDEDLLETATTAAAADVAYQGHVLPGPEYRRLHEAIARVAGPRLAHAWIALSGSMANENAWKILLQRRAPADRCLAFDRAFHGRTLAMAALTDRPEYREDLPEPDFVDRIPFYDRDDPQSTQKSVDALEAALARYPGRHAAMCFELVQGEGGFHDAPASFFTALMSRCRAAGVSVWVDEIQTFARTSGLFAFRTLGLDDLVDVVTIGKILQGSATLFTADHRPKPKLVAGTWGGSTVGMACGARILERLVDGGFLGPDGRIARLEARIDRAFARLAERRPGVVTRRSGLGAMQAFVVGDGDATRAMALVEACVEEGVLFQTAGGQPTKIRMLPPLTIDDEEIESAFAGLDRALDRIVGT